MRGCFETVVICDFLEARKWRAG
jgi:hypothetical protein